MPGRERLLLKNIQYGTGNPAGAKRFDQRELIHRAAAPGIDEYGPRRQRVKKRGIHDAARTRGIGKNAHQVIEIRGKGLQVGTMILGVHIHTGFAGPGISLDRHAEVLGCPRQTSTDRSDTHQADFPAAQCSWRGLVPFPGCLRHLALEYSPFVSQQICKDILGHEPAKNVPGVGQNIVPAQ